MGSAALNPSFAVQGGRPLPIAFGYVQGSGYAAIPYTDLLNNTYSFNILFDGECDGYEQIAITAGDQLWTLAEYGGTIRNVFAPDFVYKEAETHFHCGRWTPIGLPQTAASAGPDQGVDSFFSVIPSVTPPQSFSNMCYCTVVNYAHTATRYRGNFVPDPVQIYGVFRGARCRYFDANGNVTGYGFTTNPTWHMVELILRLKIKRNQPQNAGLSLAERGCFNWPAIYAHSQRNDTALAGGMPRFMGNYVFAAQSTLGNMLETILRCCRSYVDNQDGKIAFYGMDDVPSLFSLTAAHVFPGTFTVQEKDVTKLPNVFVPKYRDLGIAALIPVITATFNNTGATAGASSITAGTAQNYFNTGGVNPFIENDVFYYGDGSNPAMFGDYACSTNIDPSVLLPPIWAAWNPLVQADTGSGMAPTVSNGGYIGTNNSRFSQRAPTTVQHRAHQLATGSVAPGVPNTPNIVPVEYDYGNMTYEQANRLAQYECISSLGVDGPGWKLPLIGSVRVRLEAVDPVTLNAFIRMRPKEALGTFTVDPTLSPEFAGDYIITSMKVIPPDPSKNGQDALGAIEVGFKQKISAAYTDVSYPVDDSLRTITSAKLVFLGTSQLMAPNALAPSSPDWLIQATPVVTPSGTSPYSVTIPDLTLQITGNVGYTMFVGATWTAVPYNTVVTFYVDSRPLSAPVFGFVVGLTLPVGSPVYRHQVMTGFYNATTGMVQGSVLSGA